MGVLVRSSWRKNLSSRLIDKRVFRWLREQYNE